MTSKEKRIIHLKSSSKQCYYAISYTIGKMPYVTGRSRRNPFVMKFFVRLLIFVILANLTIFNRKLFSFVTLFTNVQKVQDLRCTFVSRNYACHFDQTFV